MAPRRQAKSAAAKTIAPPAKPAGQSQDPTLTLIREQKLGTKIAKACGITRQAISLWPQVPWNRVLIVSQITGRPPHLIRPDIYPPPEPSPSVVPAAPALRDQKITLA